MKALILISILALQVFTAVLAKDAFLTTIAPDLKVVSVEFGAFPADKGPGERKGNSLGWKASY